MKTKHILIHLLAATISACGSQEKSDTLKTSAHRFEGIWSAPAYGQILEIKRDAFREYSLTASHCLLEDQQYDVSLQEYESELELSEDRQNLSFQNADGAIDIHAPTVEYQRLEDLPVVCEQPAKTVSQAGYQRDLQRDYKILWDTFDELYVSFDIKGVDWETQYETGKKQITEGMNDEQFFEFLYQQLVPLKDAHVQLAFDAIGEVSFDGKPVLYKKLLDEYIQANNLTLPISQSEVGPINHYIAENLALVDQIIFSYAESAASIHQAANGKLKWYSLGDMSYLKIEAMAGFSTDPENNVSELQALEEGLDQVLSDIQGASGLIIDVRTNNGGHDYLSMAIVSRFIEQQRHVYSKQAGLGNNKTELARVMLSPRGSKQYVGPIVLLTSASTVSAAEVFTLMMSSLPNVTLMGEATQGAFSDKLDKSLPNGFRFSLSNEFYYDVQGNWYEGNGVPVDIEVPFFSLEQRTNKQDSGLETAYEFLNDQ